MTEYDVEIMYSIKSEPFHERFKVIAKNDYSARKEAVGIIQAGKRVISVDFVNVLPLRKIRTTTTK